MGKPRWAGYGAVSLVLIRAIPAWSDPQPAPVHAQDEVDRLEEGPQVDQGDQKLDLKM